MQKKIIALAIASALTVPAMAHAAATAYGQANLSYDRTNDGAATNAITTNKLTSNNSRVGLKGSDDLGGGLTAVWQIEGTVGQDMGQTGTSLFDRNTFLGVKSNDLGTVLAGNYDTPYKTATRRLDVFVDSVVADNSTNIFMLELRRANSLNFISNTMNGFSVAAATAFGAEGATSADKKGKAFSLAGMYEQGPVYVALAVDSMKIGSATGDLGATTLNALNNGNGFLGTTGSPVTWASGDKISAKKLGGGYTTSQFAVNAIIEKATLNIAGFTTSDITVTNMYLGGKYNISATDAVKAAYGKKGESKVAGASQEDSVKQITVGYDHGMSKATSVYALYTKVTEQKVGNPDPSTLSFGVKHAF